jgi:serine/threonine protein kinase
MGRAIYDDVSAEDRLTLRKYLLTMECHGDVFANSKQDQTLEQSTLGPVADFHLRRTPLAPQLPFTSSVGLAPSVHIRAPPKLSRQYTQKVHCRIVFKEAGDSLYVVRSLANVFQSLRDVINGRNCLILSECLIYAIVLNSVLEILHKYSWVHRDMSPGNIIFYDGGSRFSDFEYAQKTTRLVDDEVVTVCCLTYPFTRFM